MLNRDLIFGPGVTDPPPEKVDVDGWGEVLIKRVSIASVELIRWVNEPIFEKGRRIGLSEEELMTRRIVGRAILAVVNDEGEPTFTFDDADMLRERWFSQCILVAGKALELSHQSAEEPSEEPAEEPAGEIEA